MIHRINAQMSRLCNPRFEQWGVDLVTSRMLVALLERGSMSSGDIVRMMALPQSTISHQIKRLEALGYVTRALDERDSRVVIASLTPRGQEVATAANELSRTVTDQLVAAIGGDEAVAEVRAALKRMDAALAALAPDSAELRLPQRALRPPAPDAGDSPPSHGDRP